MAIKKDNQDVVDAPIDNSTPKSTKKTVPKSKVDKPAKTKAKESKTKAKEPKTKESKAKEPKPKEKEPKAKESNTDKNESLEKPKKERKSTKSDKKAPVDDKKSVDKPKKIEKPAKKPKVIKDPKPEKVGLKISAARVKNIINSILNHDEMIALNELLLAYGKDAVNKVNKEGKTVEIAPSIPAKSFDQLSQQTIDLVNLAKQENKKSRKTSFTKKKITELPEKVKISFFEKKKAAKEAHENKIKDTDEKNRTKFNEEAFILSFDPNFYKTFEEDPQCEDKLKQAIDLISKRKVRFSATAKMFVSIFMELFIQQLSTNGLVSCVSDGKGIIRLNHTIETKVEGFDDRFPLFNLIVNTNTYKKALENLVKPSETPKNDDKPSSKLLDKKENFTFYVADICKKIKSNFGSPELKDKYASCNISKEFKEFCSNLIVEKIVHIGQMLKTEAQLRGVKTINDQIIKIMIHHMHTACGLNATKTIQSIENTITEYKKNKKNKQSNKKKKESSDQQTETPINTQKPIIVSTTDDESEKEDGSDDENDSSVEWEDD
jgi:hypothetical protein